MDFTLCCVLSLLFGICFANHNEPDAVCSLPADSGMCYAYFPMVFYDAPSGKCINFVYGGCGGNENKFWTEDECMKRCGGSGGIGKEPVEEEKGPIWLGPAEGGQEDIVQKPVDEGKGAIFPKPADVGKGVILQQPIDGGKGVIFHRPVNEGKGVILHQIMNVAKGTPFQHPPASDVCNLEKQSGNCSSQLVRYYFDKDTRKCERFLYSGCGKNANNFNHKFECERTCPGEKDIGDACNFDREAGPCRAFFPRFYFSRESGQCEQFVYGGCGGNHNNFKTKEECLRFCTSGKGSPLP